MLRVLFAAFAPLARGLSCSPPGQELPWETIVLSLYMRHICNLETRNKREHLNWGLVRPGHIRTYMEPSCCNGLSLSSSLCHSCLPNAIPTGYTVSLPSPLFDRLVFFLTLCSNRGILGGVVWWCFIGRAPCGEQFSKDARDTSPLLDPSLTLLRSSMCSALHISFLELERSGDGH